MSQFNATTYDVARSSGRCALTGKALEPLETYVATLVDDGAQLQRLDVCDEAWEAGKRPEHLFSYWKTSVPEASARKKVFVDDQVLLDMVRRLADADQEQRIAFRFVITLILMRKKLLRYDGPLRRTGVAADGTPIEAEWWIMTPKLDLTKGPMGKWNDQDKFEVLDPRLDETRILQVTEQLGEILQAEL